MTSYLVTPNKQKISIDPYTGKLFDFDTVSSRVYLSRTINNLLRVFGTDIVLKGLDIKELKYNADPAPDESTDSVESISITLNLGKCIIDTTLIEFEEDIIIPKVEISSFDDDGYLLLFISFKYSESIYENQAKFKLIYLDATKRATSPIIDPTADRILLAVFKFNKEANTIKQTTDTSITINKKYHYEVYPYNDFKKAAEHYVKTLFS